MSQAVLCLRRVWRQWFGAPLVTTLGLLCAGESAVAQQPIVAPAPPSPFAAPPALGTATPGSLIPSNAGLSTPETVLSSEPISREEAFYLGSVNFIDPGGPDFWNPDLEKSRGMASRWPFVTWYLKAGTVTPVGGGFLEDHARTGFTVQTGGRAPISDPDAPIVWFGELGGTYMGNDGTGDSVTRSGVLIATPPPIFGIPQPSLPPIPIADFYNTYLTSMRRGSLQLGTGLQFTPQFSANQGWKKLQFNTRGGLRVGHARMKYLDTYTADLAAAIAAQPAVNSISLQPANVFELGDTFFGLFTSIGVAMTWEDVCWGPCYFKSVSIGGDIEYSAEWIDTGAFSPNDDALSTLVPTVSLNLRW